MSHAIIVERLSKRYTIGERRDDLIQERLARWLRRPFTTKSGKPFDTIWALKDISVQVENGEVLGIVGANGAGKSTFLKVLSRITYPTSGGMKLKGRVAALLAKSIRTLPTIVQQALSKRRSHRGCVQQNNTHLSDGLCRLLLVPG